MARIETRGETFRVQLNTVERISACYWGEIWAQKNCLVDAKVILRPNQAIVDELADVGWLVSLGAPTRFNTIQPRARDVTGGRACVVAYRNRPAALFRFRQDKSRWNLWIVSDANAEELVEVALRGLEAK